MSRPQMINFHMSGLGKLYGNGLREGGVPVHMLGWKRQNLKL